MESKHNNSLEGKKVVVLGGSSGIGLATAQAAAAAGARVVIVSSNQARIDSAVKLLPEGSSRGVAVDLSQEANIRSFFESNGQFDHLVYTAGENLSLGNIKDTDINQARDFFTIRFWGAFAAVKYGAPYINQGGSVTLTSGIAGSRPGAGWGVAAGICGAMDAFVRAMAVELAPVRVNNVAPGVVKTNLWNSIPEEARHNLYKTTGNSLPVKRVGEAEDIAATFLYLMQQPFGTGQSVIVDGGAVLV